MEFRNLSDGESDGFTIFYLKGKKLHAVLLNEEQAGILDLSLGIVFAKSKARVVDADEVVMRGLIKENNSERLVTK